MNVSKTVISLFLGPPSLLYPPIQIPVDSGEWHCPEFDLFSQPPFNQRDVNPTNMDSFLNSFVELEPTVLSDSGGVFLVYTQRKGVANDTSCQFKSVTLDSFKSRSGSRLDKYGDFTSVDDVVKLYDVMVSCLLSIPLSDRSISDLTNLFSIISFP